MYIPTTGEEEYLKIVEVKWKRLSEDSYKTP